LNAIAKIREWLSQQRERLWPFRVHLLVLVCAVLLGVGVGLIKASRTPAKALVADRWTLPRWTPPQVDPARQELLSAPIFTQDPAKKQAEEAAAAAAAIPPWRFTGTVLEGHQQVALIEVDKGRHIRRLAPGDELPGGAKVTSVKSGELTYTDSAGEQVLKLFSPEGRSGTESNHKKR
jgi:hypothetical protein